MQVYVTNEATCLRCGYPSGQCECGCKKCGGTKVQNVTNNSPTPRIPPPGKHAPLGTPVFNFDHRKLDLGNTVEQVTRPVNNGGGIGPGPVFDFPDRVIDREKQSNHVTTNDCLGSPSYDFSDRVIR